MKLFKRTSKTARVAFCERCGEICNPAECAERSLERVKLDWAATWGLGRTGR